MASKLLLSCKLALLWRSIYSSTTAMCHCTVLVFPLINIFRCFLFHNFLLISSFLNGKVLMLSPTTLESDRILSDKRHPHYLRHHLTSQISDMKFKVFVSVHCKSCGEFLKRVFVCPFAVGKFEPIPIFDTNERREGSATSASFSKTNIV